MDCPPISLLLRAHVGLCWHVMHGLGGLSALLRLSSGPIMPSRLGALDLFSSLRPYRLQCGAWQNLSPIAGPGPPRHPSAFFTDQLSASFHRLQFHNTHPLHSSSFILIDVSRQLVVGYLDVSLFFATCVVFLTLTSSLSRLRPESNNHSLTSAQAHRTVPYLHWPTHHASQHSNSACLPSSMAAIASNIYSTKPKTITPLHNLTIITTAGGEHLVSQPPKTLSANTVAQRV
jgi:hypothetical protein